MSNTIVNKKQHLGEAGFTLIEMMIALVLGLFVTAVIITVFSTNVRSSTENIKMIRLNQELRGAMTMMVDELKRHGYSSNSTNPDFMKEFNVSFTTTSTCIRYSYDEINRPSPAVDGVRDDDERFGFKLEGNEVKWVRSGGAVGALGTPNCGTGWQAITDPNLASITTLNFDITGSTNSESFPCTVTGTCTGSEALTTSNGVSVYDVTITLTGTTDLPHSSPANDPRRTLIEMVRIRNEAPKN